jgi:hypothetical protein
MSTLSAWEKGSDNYLPKSRVSPLSESMMKELQVALTDQLKRLDSPTPELTKLLKRVGAEARQKNVNPEELIVVFKQMWNSLAESVRPQNAELHDRMRQTLVTLCIQAYYAE